MCWKGCLFLHLFRKLYIPAENSQGGNFGSSDTEHGAVRGIMYQEGGDQILQKKVYNLILEKHLEQLKWKLEINYGNLTTEFHK